jgi:hypothetical protein
LCHPGFLKEVAGHCMPFLDSLVWAEMLPGFPK